MQVIAVRDDDGYVLGFGQAWPQQKSRNVWKRVALCITLFDGGGTGASTARRWSVGQKSVQE